MNKRILLVDDDPDIISGYQRSLRKSFSIKTFSNPSEALETIRMEEPYAAIVSDYRMPEMNGVEFLSKAKKLSQDSVRMIVTGFADLQIAIDAVNKGNVYRFLTKPLPTDDLILALEDAVELYRLITSEKELLDKTLKGSIKLLIDILSSTLPQVFSQANKNRRLARRIGERLRQNNLWEIEIASMLSQIGCIIVPQEILDKYYSGEDLSDSEMRLFMQNAETGYNLVKNIPRLEQVAEAIKNQYISLEGDQNKTLPANVPFMAKILSVLNDYSHELIKTNYPNEAMFKVLKKAFKYDDGVLSALKDEISGIGSGMVIRAISFKQLRIAMILAEDVKDDRGSVLIARGQEITDVLLLKLISISKVRTIVEPILVYDSNKTT